MSELSDKERRDARKWLFRMLDRPDIHRAGFDAWIAENPARLPYYQKLFDGAEDMAQSAERRGILPPPVPARPRWHELPGELRWRPVLATVFVSMVALAVAFRTVPGMWVPKYLGGTTQAHLSTELGEVRPERLSDGTLVTLDTATAIDVKLSGDRRTVVLRHGRARFAVARARNDTPFVVVDGSHSVVADAGVFDVSDRGSLSALVVQGKAAVRLRPAAFFFSSDSSVALSAGEKIVLASGQNTLPSAIPARSSDAQWVGGVKSFNDVPISEVIAEANTYSRTKIVLADPSLGRRTIDGDLHIRDVEAVAQAIAVYLRIKIDISRNGELILHDAN